MQIRESKYRSEGMDCLCFSTYMLPKDKSLTQKIISSQILMSEQDDSLTYPNDHDVLGDCHLRGKYNN